VVTACVVFKDGVSVGSVDAVELSFFFLDDFRSLERRSPASNCGFLRPELLTRDDEGPEVVVRIRSIASIVSDSQPAANRK